ncbi:class I adenylate-forming enzyme family protein [Anaeromicropila populeti]|uniref:Acyl-CoA synthetase (AMP-forming)/AMP-acid ligase II n=1 Tax=Anaeromicropila populeti TaxID=37658 RepID=A0A1I6HS51_9FIRM|nr:class I adenylate-forming enzyme family protein [Anaeromicropila populeti]SFR57255.1 Acyl-CoA synthetase (AMP-forming)/AMP-acid ligase II [Anaeromicropila populeti]
MSNINKLLNELKNNYYDQGIYDYARQFEKFSYGELVKRVEEEAGYWEELGVRKGSCVLFILPTSIDLLIHILAVLKIGATPSPISNVQSSVGYSYIQENLKPFLIYTTNKKIEISVNFQETKHCFADKGRLFCCSDNQYNEIYKNSIVLTSSGSTGYPKSILHYADNIILNAQLHMEAIGEKPGGTYLSSLQAFFSYGLVAGIIGSLTMGKNIVMPERPFYPNTWFEYCQRFDITLSSMTPGLLKKLLRLDEPFPASLKKITIGGERADFNDIEILRSKYKGDIYLTYGLSEAGPRVCTNEILDTNKNEWQFMGTPMSGVDIRIMDDMDSGELLIFTPTLMRGYVEKGNLLCNHSSGIMNGNWLRTGDICIKRNNHYLYVERAKKIIKCNGEMIFPALIRNVIMEHEEIDDAVVVAKPNEAMGYEPIAYIKLKDGVRAIPDLKRHCSKKLRLLEIPREFIVSDKIENFKK